MSEWVEAEGALTKSYTFADFRSAFGFMTLCALDAERLNHHPEWTNVYNRVDVRLTTHDQGGVTEKDRELAGLMDAHAATVAGK